MLQNANLQGVLPRAAETFIRNLADHVIQQSTKLNSLLAQPILTSAQAEAAYGSKVTSRQLQSDGSAPLNVTGLLGVLAQPQQSSAPKVTTLPGFSDPKSQDGALVSFNSVLYRFDASPAPGAWVPQFANSVQPYDIQYGLTGLPGNGVIYPLLTFPTARVVSFPANFTGSAGSVEVNPTGTSTFTLKRTRAGVVTTIGTIVVSTGGVVTFTTTGGLAFSNQGSDRWTITAPSPQDATLAGLAFTLTGTR